MRRLLFIAHRVPYPPDKGERVRGFHEIRALSSFFRVTVAALAHGREDSRAAEGLATWCQNVFVASAGGLGGRLRAAAAVLRGRSATEGYFHSRTLRKALPHLAGNSPFDVALGYCSSTLGYLLACPARARVMDFVDVDSAKWEAYARSSAWPKSWLYRREAAAVSALERQAARRCDAVLAVSPGETALLGEVHGRVLAVGNGVDTDYFAPPEAPARPAHPTLVFTGTMDYRPNVEGVGWFVREVWPRLRRRHPDLEFQIVGRDPAPEVRRLAREPGVAVTGSVPDVRPFLGAAAAAVCPLQIARGIQNKVLEAMAMARPVVASSPALEGLDLRDETEVLRADTPPEWEERIATLLADPEAAEAVGRRARQCVVRRFGWEARLRPLVDLCCQLAGEAPA